jgi:hypothetical protein
VYDCVCMIVCVCVSVSAEEDPCLLTRVSGRKNEENKKKYKETNSKTTMHRVPCLLTM